MGIALSSRCVTKICRPWARRCRTHSAVVFHAWTSTHFSEPLLDRLVGRCESAIRSIACKPPYPRATSSDAVLANISVRPPQKVRLVESQACSQDQSFLKTLYFIIKTKALAAASELRSAVTSIRSCQAIYFILKGNIYRIGVFQKCCIQSSKQNHRLSPWHNV